MTKIYEAGEVDVVVIGAGHSGIEAALACARLKKQTIIMSISLDSILLFHYFKI